MFISCLELTKLLRIEGPQKFFQIFVNILFIGRKYIHEVIILWLTKVVNSKVFK